MSYMDEKEFLELYYPAVAKDEEVQKAYSSGYKSVTQYLDKYNKDEEISSDEFAEYFKEKKCNSLSQFYFWLKMLRSVMESHGFYFKSIRNLAKVNYNDIFFEEDFEKSYFGSLDEIFDVITKIEGKDSSHSRIKARVVCGLLWFGFNLEAVGDILVEDVNFKNQTILNKKSGELVEISKDFASYLSYHLSNEKYNGGYLLCGKTGDRIRPTTAGKNLSSLNEYTEEFGKEFKAHNILLSGLFARVYDGKDCLDKYRKDKALKFDLWVKVYRG